MRVDVQKFIDLRGIMQGIGGEDPDVNISSYDEIVRAMAEKVLIESDDDDWQGDSYRLLQNGGEEGQNYGILIFGWGSCSGCDMLQSCSTPQDYQELADKLWQGIRWFTDLESLARYLQTEDQETVHWYNENEAYQRFRQNILDYVALQGAT